MYNFIKIVIKFILNETRTKIKQLAVRYLIGAWL